MLSFAVKDYCMCNQVLVNKFLYFGKIECRSVSGSYENYIIFTAPNANKKFTSAKMKSIFHSSYIYIFENSNTREQTV